MKKHLSLLLVFFMLLNMLPLSACSIKPGEGKETGTEAPVPPAPVVAGEETVTMTPQAPQAVFGSGVSVEMSSYLVREDQPLTVTEMSPVTLSDGSEWDGFRLTVYDVTMGERHQFGEYFTIRLPYDPSYLESGQDPSLCVTARWHDPETGAWEPVLYSLDTEKHQVVIRTDHLSEYGCFEIKNEGMRKARVTYVKPWMMYELFDTDTACDVLSDYNASRGTDTRKAATLGAKLINKMQPIASGVSDFTSEVGALDNILRLGDSEAGLVLKEINIHQKTVDVIGKVGLAASCIKLAIEVCSSDKTDADVISIYKDTVSLMLDLASASETFGSAALSVGLAGVWIFDQILTKMVDQAKAIRMELFGAVYTYYNDTYSGYGHKARTDDDWRDIMIAEYEKAKGDTDAFTQAMNQQMADYADKFWVEVDRNPDMATELQDDMGITRLPLPTGGEIEALKKQYINNLQVRINNLIPAVRDYYREKSEEAFEKALNEAKTHLNSALNCTINDPDKLFEGCTVRFAPLSDVAIAGDWQGTMNALGTLRISFTVLGYYIAGCPDRVEVIDKADGKTIVGYGTVKAQGVALTVDLMRGEPVTSPESAQKVTLPTKVVRYDGTVPDASDDYFGSRGGMICAAVNQMESPCFVYDPATTYYSIDLELVPNEGITLFGSENGLGTEGQYDTYYISALTIHGTFSFEKNDGSMNMTFTEKCVDAPNYSGDVNSVAYTFSNEPDKFSISYDDKAHALYVAFYGDLTEQWSSVKGSGEQTTQDPTTREDHREAVCFSFTPVVPFGTE